MKKVTLLLSLIGNLVLFLALKVAKERNDAFERQIIAADKKAEMTRNDQEVG